MEWNDNKYVRFADMWQWIDNTSARYFYSRLEALGLTRGQPKMLRFLEENDGCRQKDIAERFYMRAASVSGILSSMEKQGLIERKMNPESRRETLVYLTDQGKEKLEQVKTFYMDLDEDVFAFVDEDEFEQMMSTLQKIQKLLDR